MCADELESGISGCVSLLQEATEESLGGMQAKIAVACKAIRVFYVVLQTGCDFDEEKFRKDIIHPEAA